MVFYASIAQPARACLNDTSVERGEQEFRSQYNQPAKPENSRQAGLNPWAFAALAVGAGLATGSLIVAVGRQRRGGK